MQNVNMKSWAGINFQVALLIKIYGSQVLRSTYFVYLDADINSIIW